MASKKEISPPAKPPVSRLSLGKIKGKQGSTGSIAIHFNAASLAEDDYDLNDDLSVGSYTTKPRSDSVKFEIRSDYGKVHSQSAPTSEVSTPVAAARPASNTRSANGASVGHPTASGEVTPVTGEKSILSGLKERFHDKLPEPINAFIEKIEVLKDSSPEDIKKKFHKSESQESEASMKLSQSDSGDRISVRKSESMESTRSMPSSLKGSLSDIANKNRSRQGSTESEVSEAGNSSQNDAAVKTDKCFEVVEDYYNDDDSFDEPATKTKSAMGKSLSTEPFPQKQKSSSLRKLIKQKDRSSSPVQGMKTMTFSGLLSSKSDDSIHSHTTSSDLNLAKAEPEVFYDVEEQDKKPEEPPQSSDISKASRVDQAEGTSSVHKYLAIAAGFIACLIIPMPSFVSGFVFGATLTYSVVQIYQWLWAPPKPKEPFILPDLKTLPPLVVPEMKESRNTDGKFQGWMNELQSYSPDDYHINLTASVYVTLEGTTLRLQRPKVNVPKRAMWDEPAHNPTFIHQRHFDLKGSRVFLEPAGLVKKRVWSKKYPICIALPKDHAKASDTEKRSAFAEGSKDEKEKKLIAQASLDEEKMRSSERKEKKLVVQMSLDELRLQHVTSEKADGVDNNETKDKNTKSAVNRVSTRDMLQDYDVFEESKDKATKNVVKRVSTRDMLQDYDVVLKEECDTKILYLFGRTGREKEEWYRRLVAASEDQPWPTRMSDLRLKLPASTTARARSTSPTLDTHSHSAPLLRKRHSSSSLESIPPTKQHQRQGSADSATLPPSAAISESESAPAPAKSPPNSSTTQTEDNDYERVLTEYLKYMSVVLPARRAGKSSRATSPVTGSGNKRDSPEPSADQCEPACVWVNAALSRCFWDFLREPYWAGYMKQKIQRKLSKIHVPFFIDELTVTDIMLGSEMPLIRRISRPYLDDRGLWVDMDVAYNGGFQMSLETKVNLMKLKKEKHLHTQLHKQTNRRAAVLNEEEEDSAESSTDEEAEVTTYVANDVEAHGGSTGKKFLRLVDKLTQNKYFQQATENKYVKRAMEGVSNTPIMLNVELRSLIGTLAVNIPPPPTDRIWYGFRSNPKLWLCAKPKVGERAVTVTHVTEWIEKKLCVEFQRVFVMPNMDDLPIPLMYDQLPEPPTFEPAT